MNGLFSGGRTAVHIITSSRAPPPAARFTHTVENQGDPDGEQAEHEQPARRRQRWSCRPPEGSGRAETEEPERGAAAVDPCVLRLGRIPKSEGLVEQRPQEDPNRRDAGEATEDVGGHAGPGAQGNVSGLLAGLPGGRRRLVRGLQGSSCSGVTAPSGRACVFSSQPLPVCRTLRTTSTLLLNCPVS